MKLTRVCKTCKSEKNFRKLLGWLFGDEDYEDFKARLNSDRFRMALQEIPLSDARVMQINDEINKIEAKIDPETLMELKYLHHKLAFEENHRNHLMQTISSQSSLV